MPKILNFETNPININRKSKFGKMAAKVQAQLTVNCDKLKFLDFISKIHANS